MKRRGYIIAGILLVIDCLCFSFGGVFVALAALIYAGGIGEIIARTRSRAIICDSSLGIKHQKLNNCYQSACEKASEAGILIPQRVKVYLIPGEEMNAYCFGANSIGVTEGALNLDNRTVEAVIAHELGHLISGDSVLNMVLLANCLGIIALLTVYQFALIAVVYLIMIICCLIGLFHFSFASYFITNKISGLMKIIMEAVKTVVLQINRLIISGLGRRGEFQADAFAAQIGYTFYLKRFLERFAPDTASAGQSFFSVLYDTHPSSVLRIQRLEQIQAEQGRLPE